MKLIVIFVSWLSVISCTYNDYTDNKSANTNSLMDTTIVDCNKIDYRFEIKYNPEVNSKSIVLFKESVRFHTIKLPSQVDYNGFSLNGIIKHENGLELNIEYGSRYYYQKQFYFDCKQAELFLTKVRVTTFDKHNPKDQKVSNLEILHELPINKFKCEDYLED